MVFPNINGFSQPYTPAPKKGRNISRVIHNIQPVQEPKQGIN